MKKTILLSLALLVAVLSHAGKIDFCLNLKTGATYSQNMIAKSNIKQEVNGMEMNIQMTIDGNTDYTVKSFENDVYEMDVRFTELTMSVNVPGQGNLSYSSKDPKEDDIMGQVFAGMTKESFEMSLTKYGKVLELRNVEKLWDAAFASLEDLPEEQMEQIKAQINNSFGDEALVGNMEMAFAIYKDGKVRKGDKWTIETDINSTFTGRLTTEYELVDIGKELVSIAGNGTIKTKESDKFFETGGMKIKYDMAGKMASDIKADRKTGWIIEAKITQDIKGVATILANEQIPEDMTLPMIIHTEMNIKK